MTSRTIGSRSFAALLGTLALAFVAACTETNTEYVERPQFNPPPDSVSGFMGYYDAATKQTTCGNYSLKDAAQCRVRQVRISRVERWHIPTCVGAPLSYIGA